MKKTIALIMALLLVTGTTTTALAATPEIAFGVENVSEAAFGQNETPPTQPVASLSDVEARLLDISGEGTVENPFIIMTQDDLALISDFPDCYFELGKDITLTGEWEPLCLLGDPFTGVFDGKGHTISGVTITKWRTNVGLFAQNAGTIKNVKAKVNITISTSGTDHVCGGFVGTNLSGGKIENCEVEAVIEYTLLGHGTLIGGFVGENSGIINNCRADNTINLTCSSSSSYSSYDYVGGFVGKSSGIINNCRADNTINLTYSSYSSSYYYDYVGGFAGSNSATLYRCQAVGDITITINNGTAYIAGLTADNTGTIEQCAAKETITRSGSSRPAYFYGLTNGGTIKDSYAIGAVPSGEEKIGFAKSGTISNSYAAVSGVTYGFSSNATATNCFYDKTVSGCSDTGHGAPKSTTAMKMKKTFTDAGWDFDTVWGISSDINGGYPYLLWEIPTHTVTFDAAGGTCGTSSMITENYKLSSLPTPTRTGYAFDGWYLNNTKVTTDTQYMQDTLLVAHWLPIITFDPGDGTCTVQTLTVGTNGKLSSLPTPTRTGYFFTDWYYNGVAVTTATVFTAPAILTAGWQKSYAVTFDAAGGNCATSVLYTDKTGRIASLPTPTRSSYYFDGWYDGQTAVTSTSYVYTKDTTLVAQWIKSYTVTFDAAGGTCGTSVLTTDKDGKISFLPTPTREGYFFDAWYDGQTAVTSTNYVFTGNTQLVAQWIKSYAVTFDAGEGECDTSVLYTDRNGKLTVASLPVPTRDGYFFDAWYDGQTAVLSTDYVFTDDTTLSAAWIKAPVVTFDAGEGECDVPFLCVDRTGKLTVASLPVPTREGFYFNGWYTVTGTLATLNTVFTEDTTLIAAWVKATAVTFDPAGGTCSVSVMYANRAGQLVDPLPVPTRDDYTFEGWYLGTARVSASTVFDGDTTVTAAWSFNYPIVYDASALRIDDEGMHFRAHLAKRIREDASQYGFLFGADDAFTQDDYAYFNFRNLVGNTSDPMRLTVGTDTPGVYKYISAAIAFDTEKGIDRVAMSKEEYEASSDTIFGAVLQNIQQKDLDRLICLRTFLRLDGTTYYSHVYTCKAGSTQEVIKDVIIDAGDLY